MKSCHLITFMLIATILTGCHKDDLNKEPKVTEESINVSATAATFTWTVDWPGKLSSVVEVSENEDMSNSQTFGSEAETEDHNFTVTATDLKEETGYYYRYLIWNKNYVDKKFKTEVKGFNTLYDGLAAMTTAEVSDIDFTTATCGGNVTYDGGHTVTERGVCWSTNPNPDINGSHMSSGSGMSSFICSITNLEQGTQYYVRAYATNSVGTSYGNEVGFTTKAVPVGVINGLFSVSSTEQVYFSQGNLQYDGSTNTWKFADHQWEVIGEGQDNSSQGTIRDLFGWGTSGWDCGNTFYRPFDTGGLDGNYYGPSGSNNLTGNYANSDWGVYNAISNGGNQAGLWRTLTKAEWTYLFNAREGTWLSGVVNARYAKAEVNGMSGVILFPDSYTHPSGVPEPNNINNSDASFASNSYSGDDWNQLEQAGCVFLPAAGYRHGVWVNSVGSRGDYWSSSYYLSDNAYFVYFSDTGYNPDYGGYRNYGRSVRLVRNAQ